MAEVGRHPNIKILTNTDIEAVEGGPGRFTVMVTRRPRYVDEDLCVGCRTCASYCPYTLSNPFDENLSNAKAIDIWCPQAIPAVAVVNRDACLYFQNKCTICLPTCKAKAIDFKQKKKKGRMHVGAIVVSPGYDIFDAKRIGEYGYGRMSNVVNSLEFERLLSAGGPHGGEVLRPSDKKVPERVAWLQCVGSRDERVGHTYCSGVCCTYAVKQVFIMKNHYPEVEATVFHNDIRTFGKGFEELYARVQAMKGVQFIRTRISAVKENKKNNNLRVCYVAEDHTIREEEFGMVILSVGLNPKKSSEIVPELINAGPAVPGFCTTSEFSPNELPNQPGFFPAATFVAPMDIPDSISSAAGAASRAAQLLADHRGELAVEKQFPEEKAVEGKKAKIGVFICHCGTNIAGVADIQSVAQYAATLRDVAHCEDQLIACAADSLKKITEAIKQKALNRVVIAACTPRGHEPLFRVTLQEAGLNQYLLEMANIREHCTWVHAQDRYQSTQKAKEVIAMSVARARRLTPLEEIKVPVIPKGLVLGGGLAGMKAALALAELGFRVYLVEKENELGGNAKTLYYTLEGATVQPFLKQLIADVEGHEKIKVLKGYELQSLSGFVGNFESTIQKGSTDTDTSPSLPVVVQHGIIIVATGGKLLIPAEYRYCESKKIITQQELESRIGSGEIGNGLQQVLMIQCVGARNEQRPYCSRICCGEAVKNALKLKELNEDTEIIILYRDIRTYGLKEDYYRKARQKGVLFILYTPERAPRVEVIEERPFVTFYDSTVNLEGTINPDLVVLTTPVTGGDNKKLSQVVKVPIGRDGFFQEAHMKLRPLDFSSDGIFLCGMAQYPKYIPEAISQAEGAAIRAAAILSQDAIVCSGAVCEVDEECCIACSACESACPYDAVTLHNTAKGLKAATVNAALCKGCGTCNAKCPVGAITLNHFRDDQIISQITALGGI